MNNNEIILEGKDIWKLYKKGGENIEVLKGLDFSIRKGEAVLILGPSGSGKTTLLHLLGFIDLPTKGKILLRGEDVFNKGDGEISRLRNELFGFVFQFYNLIPELTAIENCIMPLLIRGIPLKDAKNKALLILRKLGLEKRVNHYPNDLSGGEEQRVAIARAIIGEPIILFADEPTGNLDSKNEKVIMDIFFTLHIENKMTMVVVSHNESLSERFEKVFYLKNGNLLPYKEDRQPPIGK